jgi:hypothetical protein
LVRSQNADFHNVQEGAGIPLLYWVWERPQISDTLTINKKSIPLSALMLYFTLVHQLLLIWGLHNVQEAAGIPLLYWVWETSEDKRVSDWQ